MRRSHPAILLLALAVGCATPQSQAAVQPSTAACRAPGKPIVPHSAGTLTAADNGALVCGRPDQEIAVLLAAPSTDPSDRWQPITAQPNAPVRRGNAGLMTLPIGTTAGLFIPTAAGRIELASHRPGGTTWHATLLVG